MVTLKCKLCGSTDVTAMKNGFICENCKSVYGLNEMSELINRENEPIYEEKTNNESCSDESLEQFDDANRQKPFAKIFGCVAVVIGIVLFVIVFYPSICKNMAKNFLAQGNYADAYKYYSKVSDTKAMERVCIEWADSYMKSGNQKDAVLCLQKINNEEETKRFFYRWAENYLNKGDNKTAAVYFGKAIGYHDAKERSFKLWDDIAVRVKAAKSFLYALGRGDMAWIMSDGTVKAQGEHYNKDHIIYGFSDIVSVFSSGDGEIIGLKSDGTVVSTSSQKDYSDLKNVVGIYNYHTGLPVFLLADGTIIKSYGLWFEADNIIAYDQDIVLCSDGTVVASPNSVYSKAEYVSGWNDIIDVASTYNAVFALKADGTVLSVDKSGSAVVEIANWKNIKNIAGDGDELLGLKHDGTIVSTNATSKANNESGIIDMYESAGGIVFETTSGYRSYIG